MWPVRFADPLTQIHTPRDAVRIEFHVHVPERSIFGQPAERKHFHGLPARAKGIDYDREHHRGGGCQTVCKRPVAVRVVVRRLGKHDVHCNGASAAIHQPRDQRGRPRPRPRPATELAQTGFVDGDDHHIRGNVRRNKALQPVVQQIVYGTGPVEPACAEADAGNDNHQHGHLDRQGPAGGPGPAEGDGAASGRIRWLFAPQCSVPV